LPEPALHGQDLIARVLEEKRKTPKAPVRHTHTRAPRSLPESIRSVNAQAITPIIGEIKPRSPTQGFLRRVTDPREIVREMVAADVAGISVLTEGHFFGGSKALLAKAAACSEVPILMKDFLTTEEEIQEARRLGADAVLLIVRLLGKRMHNMYDKAMEEGLTPLVEVHTRSEMQAAASLEPELVAINNRDLSSLKVDLQTTRKLSKYAPKRCLVVSESGYRSREDVEKMESYCDAFLVGSALMTADVRGKLLELQGRVTKWFG